MKAKPLFLPPFELGMTSFFSFPYPENNLVISSCVTSVGMPPTNSWVELRVPLGFFLLTIFFSMRSIVIWSGHLVAVEVVAAAEHLEDRLLLVEGNYRVQLFKVC